MELRTVGVEEEFLLVDHTGRPRPLGEDVVARARRRGPGVEHELKLEQAETGSAPQTDLAALRTDLAERRRSLAAAAAAEGVRVAALATSPLPVEPTPTDDPRYRAMAQQYGLTAAEQLTCGCHVHVGISSRDEGARVVDRVRPWLPVLSAMAANSPYWQGRDTGYASYRRMVWDRWPGAGPSGSFADAGEYDAVIGALQRSGVLLDAGMVYFDVRLSARWPTVEVRVADVLPEVDDAVLLAALTRALVETAAAGGGAPAGLRVELLRGAAWRAARSGLSGDLVDPVAGEAVPARELVGRLLEHVTPTLLRSGDLDLATNGIERLFTRGTGADLQRASFARAGRLEDVVADAVSRTVPAEAG